jgi:hypothetical protein
MIDTAALGLLHGSIDMINEKEGQMAEHVITALATCGLPNLVNLVTAVGALGSAAMGLVDTTKLFGGGPSNFGFGHIEGALAPFLDPLAFEILGSLEQ